jgi:diadenosine tetraphosphate (Ap4A) HIT family hydrolase
MIENDASGPARLICAKHRGEGPLVGSSVWADDQVLVFHRPVGDDGTTVLGYLFVETRRHVAWLDDLTDREAETVAHVVTRAARGLRVELGADFVFSAIVGMGVPHFHQHLFVRHPGTPSDDEWTAGHEWPSAPRGGSAEIAELCARLRPYLESQAA